MLAIDERNEWRLQMQQLDPPDVVINAINLYRELRNSLNWRSTCLAEALGEAALLWYESYITQVNKDQ